MGYYFSYGSNNYKQVRERTEVDSIDKPHPARLSGYKRVFQGKSENWPNSAKANIVSAHVTDFVFGSLYDLPEGYIAKLATYEHSYRSENVEVFDLETESSVLATVFLVDSIDPISRPSADYLNAVRQNLADVGLS
ncbi:gamma-glutamylcyclotransferase [Candidatus Saccharibacteria bacterium]|nr:gamma-glutamylcyclotransferase [Candidatus Saccharibacteria bacterium]